MLSAEAIFSCTGSNVTRRDQTWWPVATDSLWMTPSGLAEYRYRRSGSITGVDVVTCGLPGEALTPRGTNSHSLAPVAGSIAIVLPYEVVTAIRSRTRPPTSTSLSSTADESAIPLICTVRSVSCPRFEAVIPVLDGPTPLRCES